jgi:hypothetical protein
MMRLTELVLALVDDAAAKSLEVNPRVLVAWYMDDGELVEREIEAVYLNLAGDVTLHCPRPAQLAGELGAGDVVDESDVELDVELLLEVALGNTGCGCPADVCKCPGDVQHPACRERLAAELAERQRRSQG